MRINIGPIQIRRKISIGPLKLGIKKIFPELENLEIIPTTEEQNFESKKYGFNEVKVKPIPEEYIVSKVVKKTLVLSRVNIEEGGLIL